MALLRFVSLVSLRCSCAMALVVRMYSLVCISVRRLMVRSLAKPRLSSTTAGRGEETRVSRVQHHRHVLPI